MNTEKPNLSSPLHMNSLPINKVVCVGRNYADHATELGNAVPTEPLLFIKPSSAVVSINNPIQLPNFGGNTHFEAELCIQIKHDLYNANLEEVKNAIAGVTLGLDLTLRDIQNKLKANGHPWERAKAFAGSCVLADWITVEELSAKFLQLNQVHYQLDINDKIRQQGDTSLMLFPVYELLVDISHAFGLQAGDVVMTGTPKGVGVLNSGDKLKLQLTDNDNTYVWQTSVL